MATRAEGAASTTITRDTLVTMGRGGDAWQFVPLCIHALTIVPSDHELRFLLAAAYAKLGLRTAARETLDELSAALGSTADGQQHPAIAQLAGVVNALPDDRVPLSSRLRTLERNLAALESRAREPVDVQHAIGPWTERAAKHVCFQARGGNVLLRDQNGRWLRFVDDVSRVDATVPQAASEAHGGHAPVLVEGASPPWLLKTAYQRTPTRPSGARTLLVFIESDLNLLCDGLSMADLTDVLADDRVRVFAGSDAGTRLDAWLDQRDAFSLGQMFFLGPNVPAPATAEIEVEGRVATVRGGGEILRHALLRQAARYQRLHEQATALYAARDKAWWARRYHEAFAGGPPLRVLIPTSRFTSYVQHSCQDLAEALCERGCDVRVILEPDNSSRSSAIACWREYAQWQPDLILAVNHTRRSLPIGAPSGVPFVTWVQDQAGQLYSREVGASLGELDFVVGYLTPALFTTFGYPKQRTLYFPVVAGERKFHAGPVSDAQRKRFTCEVGYVSHNSEPIDGLIDSLVATLPQATRARMMEALREFVAGVEPIINSGLSQWVRYRTGLVAAKVLRKHVNPVATDADLANFNAGFASPIVERMLRHQMLEWAADLCDRRGWRLHLYGRGWEKHPRFARYAKGELTHGDDLRAAYQCARVSLHAAMGFHQHQRISESALSGGVTLPRYKREDIDVMLLWWGMGLDAASPGEQTRGAPRWSCESSRWEEPALQSPMQIMEELHRDLGFEIPDRTAVVPEPTIYPTREQPWPYTHGTPVTRESMWLTGDPRSCGFWDQSSFDAVAKRVIEHAAFRDGLAVWQRLCARSAFTSDGVAVRLPAWLGDELARE